MAPAKADLDVPPLGSQTLGSRVGIEAGAAAQIAMREAFSRRAGRRRVPSMGSVHLRESKLDAAAGNV